MTVRFLTCAAALVALAGCPKTVEPVDAGRPPECTSRTECAAGKICTAQQYCENCSSSGQCRTREICDVMTTLCALRSDWGDDCSTNEECPAGSWCKQGLCQDRSAVSLCPQGTTAECPQGNRCNTITTVCEEDLGCSEDVDCSAGEVCNVGSRQCVPRCTVENQSTVCNAGEKCSSEKCVQCDTNADCGPGLKCDPAGHCSVGERCYSDRDCQVPLVCFVQTGACLAKAPPCVSNDNCADNQRCDVSAGKCVPRDCQPDRYEPDNDFTTAFGVANGSYRDLTLCPNDIDYYSLQLSRGDLLGVNIDADPFAENNFSTVIKDGTGRSLAAGKLLVSYVAPANQKYFVVISTVDPFQPYDVTFLLNRGTPCDDDALEPNDSSTQATMVNGASLLEGAICPQDQDWFSVSVPANKALTVSLVNYDAGRGALQLCAFDGATQLSCSDTATPLLQVPSASTARTLLLKVSGTSDRSANSYSLKVELP